MTLDTPSTNSDCKISVGVRVRPLNGQEKELGNKNVWNCQHGKKIKQGQTLEGKKNLDLEFDHVFDESHDNNFVYEHLAQPIISGVLDGFHGTIFAYGQTSSGKTHTLLGNSEELGLIVHSIHDIFEYVLRSPKEMEFLIRVSYLEIYNENIKDLLGGDTGGKQHSLKIVDHPKKGCEIQGLKEVVVLNPDHVFELLKKGEEKRHYGATKMNYTSSRSHTVFRLVVESRVVGSASSDETVNNDPKKEESGSEESGESAESGESQPKEKEKNSEGKKALLNKKGSSGQAVQTATLNLVDLAGSERVSKTEATGNRLKEGASINKSLLVLGTVINKLADPGHKGHIPFRDSKLTRLLKNSLGGNAKTAVVCALSPAERNLEESRSTLQFASRAKTIVNKAKKNQLFDKSALLDQYRQEIAELKIKLASGVSVVDMPELDTVREQLKQEEAKRIELEEKFEQEHTSHQQKQHELEEMRKLVLLTTKVAANSNAQLTSKMQEKIKSVANGEKAPNEVLEEVEDIAKEAERIAAEEDNGAVDSGDGKVVSFAQLGKALNIRRNNKRKLSSLCRGIVASITEQRKEENNGEAKELWRNHVHEKLEKFQQENQDLKEKLNKKEDKATEQIQVERAAQQDLKNQLEEANKEIHNLREGLKELQQEKDHQVKELTSQLEKSTEKVNELVGDVEARNNEIQSLQTEIEVMRSQKASTEQDNAVAVQKQEEKLQELLEKLQAQNGKSKEQMLSQEAQLKEFKEKVSFYETQVQRFEQLLLQTKEGYENELEKRNIVIATLEKDLESFAKIRQVLAEKDAKIAVYEKELDALHNKNVFEEASQKGHARVQEQLEGIIKDQKAKLLDAPLIKELKASESLLKEQVELMKEQVDELTKNLVARESELQQHKLDVEEYKAAEEVRIRASNMYDSSSAQHAERREASLLREIESLKQTLCIMEEKMTRPVQVSVQDLEQVMSERDQLIAHVEHLDMELFQERQRFGDLDRLHKELEKKNQDLQEELLLKTSQLEESSRSIGELNDEIFQVLSASRQEQGMARKELALVQARAQNLEAQLHRARADADQATETFLEYQKSAETRESHLKFLLSNSGGGVLHDLPSAGDLPSQISQFRSKLRSSSGLNACSSQRKSGTSISTKSRSQIVENRPSSSGSSVSSKSTGEIRNLKEQLAAAQEELSVFRRLDVYKASMKRGLRQEGLKHSSFSNSASSSSSSSLLTPRRSTVGASAFDQKSLEKLLKVQNSIN